MKSPKETVILIADDEVDLRNAIAFDFKRKGFQVLTAADGRQAFDLVKSQAIDVIISDIRMPGGDGVELLDRTKAMNPTLPVVIFLTGQSDLDVEDAYDKGAEVIFSKPFDREALHAAVARAMQPKEARWAAAPALGVETPVMELRFNDLDSALASKRFNIGRGGFFAAVDNDLPAVRKDLRFKIFFDRDTQTPLLEGDGMVRWVRHKPKDHWVPGCGIEFTRLEPAGRNALSQWLQRLARRAFIPKG